MMATVNIKQMTVAEIARKMNISRQAVHKFSKKLIEEDYITMKPVEGNNRDKLVVLTSKGEAYCKKMLILKQEIEEEIVKNIGYDNVQLLKEILRKDWI
jgi:DNA-binding MarR family transcriptional regulator